MATQSTPGVLQAKAQKNMGQEQDDFGVLPGTFVRDRGSAPAMIPAEGMAMDALKETLGKRWMYEKAYLKTKFMDLYRLFYFKFFLRKSPLKEKPKEVFFHSETKRLAKEAYVAVYEALASKSTTKLEGIAISGLIKHITKRIDARPSNVDLSWQLVRHLSSPRVMSNRFSIFPFPGADDSRAPCAFRQVVIRLKTRQRLTIECNDDAATSSRRLGAAQRRRKALAWSPDGPQLSAEAEQAEAETEAEPIEKDVTEYMVLQRVMWKGVEEGWKVWGFVDKTTLESYEQSEKVQKEMIAADVAMKEGTAA